MIKYNVNQIKICSHVYQMHYRPTHSYMSTICKTMDNRHTAYHICEPYQTLTNFDYETTKGSGSH